MDDLIGLVIFVVFLGASLFGKMKKDQGGQPKETSRPNWPGPVSGPGIPSGQMPRPQRPAQPYQPQPQWPGQPQPQWPGQPQPQPQPRWPGQPQPGPVERSGEGVSSELGGSMEGRSSMLGRSMEGRSSESIGTLAEERARFASQSDKFRRSRPETDLHHPGPEVEEPQGLATNPVAAALASKEGLAQAVLLSEVLGKPRAFRPFGKR